MVVDDGSDTARHVPSAGDATVCVPGDRLVLATFLTLLLADYSLVLLDVLIARWRLVPVAGLAQAFDMTQEANLLTWYSSTQLLFVAVFGFLCACRLRLTDAPRWRQAGWVIISLFFLYMAVDDGAYLHERLGGAFGRTVSDSSPLAFAGRYPSYHWQVLLGPMFGAMGLFILVFLQRELGRRMQWVVVAALGCYAVAVFLDFLDGYGDGDVYRYLSSLTAASRDTQQHYMRVVEEFLELLGTTLFLCIAMYRVTSIRGTVTLVFASEERTAHES